MQNARNVGPWVRRRWWLVFGVLILGLAMLTKDKPQWYLEETEVMEQVAGLLDSPVPYERTEGWAWSPHITRVVMPRVELEEEKVLQLAILLQELPRLRDVNCHYISEQRDCVEQLRRELSGHASVIEDLGASSEEKDERQKRTHVAGVHRPGIFLSYRREKERPPIRFEQRLKTGHFDWATNLPVDLVELHQLAEQARSVARRWLGFPKEEDAQADAALPIYLCANSEELKGIELEFGFVSSSFQERSNVGGYYSDGPAIAVVVSPGDATEFVVHEVIHAGLERVLPDAPYPLSEGTAMLLTERALSGTAEYAAWRTDWERRRRRVCAALNPEQLSLEALFSLDYWEFCDSDDGLNYWMSLELVRVLDRENAVRFPGKLLPLVRALSGRRRAYAFKIFTDVYPEHEVEVLWKAQLRSAARGTLPR